MQPACHEQKGIERRAQPRVDVEVFGRCLLANNLEIPCHTIDISPAGLGVKATHSPSIGEPVIVYLDKIGRMEGTVVRVYDNGFALLLGGSDHKRDKLAAKIDHLKSRSEIGTQSERRDERVMPSITNSEVRLADGSVHPTQIVDISLSGAALKIDIRPTVGTRLTLAGMQGKVVRHLDDGIAMEFA